ncbi:AbrB/MazE/SpoVT family DNA-binding domain-containing protein [Lacrimispora indolis]|uniref:AbrB/MazE/SpoVT family DNA-binding domain-containing protein n=1 Tax=Lacrimispora indolis TaxID=69825 RepID=UPI00045E92BE|nr:MULTISPECIES: AbrB/MazE/SpoVT family DNA-binding domain-containing protein [Lacrimispora]
MKSTGIIRRIDDLGRIVIPREIRRNIRVTEGSPMEILVTEEGVLLKKYYPQTVLLDLLSTIAKEVEELSADLGPEKTGDIRRYIRDIQKALKEDL